MKVVVCSLNSQYIHSALAPWYLAAGMDRWGNPSILVEVVEGTVNQEPEKLFRRLQDTRAEVIGFCCYIWNITLVRQLAERIKVWKPETIVVLGGPEAAFRAEELLIGWPAVDYIQAGEGEYPFALLMNRLYVGKEPADVPGLCRRLPAGGVAIQPPYRSPDPPPSPYTGRYFAALQGRIAYLETSRGCPFSCAFCLSGREDPVRFFDLEQAKEQLLALSRSGTRTIKLVDRTFNCHPGRARELFGFIIRARQTGEIPEGVRFHFEVAADLFDSQTLALLSEAPKGLFQLEAGLQSFHRPTLEAVTRKTDLERLCANLRVLLDQGNIHIHIDLIAGLPREDWEIFRDSFDKAYSLSPHMLQLGFLKLLHGSRLRAEARKNGCVFSPAPPYEVTETRWLSSRELWRLHLVEDALERLYNSGRFRLTLAYVLARTGLRPFDLFLMAGEWAEAQGGTQRIGLEAYTACMWTFFRGLKGIEPAGLRDVMACDILRSRRGGFLPACLYREDGRLKKLRRAVAFQAGRGAGGVQRAVVILESRREKAVVAEYAACDPVTGWYPLELAEVDRLEKSLY